MSEEIKNIVNALRSGKLAVFQADICRVIACDATCSEAVQSLLSVSKKNQNSTITLLFDETGRITNYLEEIPDVVWDLIEYSEKALTLILPGLRNIDESLLSETSHTGIRIVKDEFTKNICKSFRKPIATITLNTNKILNEKILSEISGYISSVSSQSKPAPLSIIELGKGNKFRIIQ